MLREFKQNQYEYFGLSGKRYVVSSDGVVRDTLENSIVKASETGEVEVIVLGKKIKVKLAVIVAMAFKPLYDSASFWFKWDVKFVDGNPDNHKPENLIWHPPTGGQKCPERVDFFIIPGSTQFAVNKKGTEVYSRRLDRLVKLRKNEKKRNQTGFYVVYNGWLDTGRQVTSSVHRAVALAVLPYETNVVNLTVNHKDGVKNNNDYENLEWATYAQNNIHAKDTGLCAARVPVWVKDHFTNTVTMYESLSAAGKALCTDSGHIHYCLRSKKKLIASRFRLSPVDLGDKWPKDIDAKVITELPAGIERQKDACAAVNIYTGEMYASSEPSKLMKFIGLTSDQFRTALLSPYPWPTKNYLVWSEKYPKNIRRFEDDEILAYIDRTGIKTPVRISFPDGSTKVFAFISDCSEFLALKLPTLVVRLKTGGGKAFVNAPNASGKVVAAIISYVLS